MCVVQLSRAAVCECRVRLRCSVEVSCNAMSRRITNSYLLPVVAQTILMCITHFDVSMIYKDTASYFGGGWVYHFFIYLFISAGAIDL